jgi:hypothetical protein
MEPSGFDMACMQHDMAAMATMMAGLSSTPPHMACSQTAGMSNTVCISGTSRRWTVVGSETVQDLSEFGEIARLDACLAGTLGTVLVTYFDVRCAQTVLLHMASRAKPFQPASHDCRVVSVGLHGFCAKMGHMGRFQDFGEVAHVDMRDGQAFVEFYDLRSAQALLAAAGDCASPVPGGVSAPPSPHQMRDTLEGVSAQLPTPTGLGRPAVGPANTSAKGNGGIPDSAAEQADDVTKRRVARTKITDKDFQKFDINPDAILRGADKRTTVMVRHLQGVCARTDFLSFLDRCGLGNRYSFFYMPCKEHRNVPAGFAFVNFASPQDVHTLYGAVASGLWREVCGNSPTKSPAVSYARFQGHEDLVQHFSLSVVLQEQDPEKRPIFRPEVANLGQVAIQSTSANGPMKVEAPRQSLHIPGPPGLADDANIPNHAGPAAEGGASAGKLALSSNQLQEAVEALLRKHVQGKMQVATGEGNNSKDSSGAKAPASLDKVKSMVGSIGDEESEAFCRGMTGA